jgi:hypothetical protein
LTIIDISLNLIVKLNNINNMNTSLKYSLVFGLTLMGFGCATITNDAYVPVALSFSDGSSGMCNLTNKRMAIQSGIPGSPMIRRSDDALRYDCTSDDGRKAFGSINSSIDAAKAGASVVFFDLGITDAITDKGRDYPTGFVIPLKKKQDS